MSTDYDTWFAVGARMDIVRTGEPSLVDNCSELTAELSGGNLITGIDRVFLPSVVPSGFCLDGRIATDGSASAGLTVAVYSQDDTFKPGNGPVRICGESFTEWAESRGLCFADLGIREGTRETGDGRSGDIWDLPLWPVLPDDLSPQARGRLVAVFWDPSLADPAWCAWFTDSPRTTLRELTDSADLTVREARRTELRSQLLRENVLAGRERQGIPSAEALRVFSPEDRPVLERFAAAEADELIRSYRGRFLAELGEGAPTESASSIEIPYLSSLTTPPPLRRSVKPEQIVWARSPVRMDFGGGWSVPAGTCSPMHPGLDRHTAVHPPRRGAGVQRRDRLEQPVADPGILPSPCGTGDSISLDRSRGRGAGHDVFRPRRLPESAGTLCVAPGGLSRVPQVRGTRRQLCILGFTQARHAGRTLQEVLREIGGGVEVTLLAAVPKGA